MVALGASKEDLSPENQLVHFSTRPSIDCNTVLPVASTRLDRSVAPSCICFHKEKPFLAVAVGRYVAVHDLLSGARLRTIDLQSPVSALCFTPDGTGLVAMLMDWEMMSVEMSTWRTSMLSPPRGTPDKPLDTALMAIMGRIVFFAKYGKEYLQAVPLKARVQYDAKGRIMKYKKTPVRMEPAKPIIGVDTHPTDLQLLVLHSDGVMRGYAPAGSSVVMSLLYTVQIQEPCKSLPEICPFEVHPHPNWVPGGALVIQGSRSCSVSVLEVAGSGMAAAPAFLLRTHLSNWATILGMGYNRTMSQIFVFGLNHSGQLRSTSWHLSTGPRESSTMSMFMNKVYPFNLMPLVEGNEPEAFVDETFGAQQNLEGEQEAEYDCIASLWAPSPAWAAAGAVISPLSDAHLGPRITRMIVHPVLGTVAVQMEPSMLLQASPPLMAQKQVELTLQEQILARRTASVPLLCAINHADHLLGWHGSTVTIQHTPLHAWRPPPGFGAKLHLPGHLFFLGQDACLSKFAAVTREGEPLLALPSATTNGLARHPRTILKGKQGALMIFFELPVQSRDKHDKRSKQEQWQWTLLQPDAFEGTPTPAVWFKPGKYGTFIGHNDAYFAVIESTGTLGAVFHTASTNHANAVPLYTFNLDGCSIAGCAMPLFNGPPSSFQELQAGNKRSTAMLGSILWQTPKGLLVGAALPAVQGMPQEKDADDDAEAEELDKIEQLKAQGFKVEGEDEESEDETDSTESIADDEDPTLAVKKPQQDDGLVAGDDSSSEDEKEVEAKKRAEERALERKKERSRQRAQKKGPQGVSLAEGAHFGKAECLKGGLALLPGEKVLQVAWQSMLMVPTGRKARPPAMGAVLTNKRVLLITSLLQLHAAVDLSSSSRAAVSQPLTSMLWVGPALLVLTSDGRVIQVTWWGSTHPVCHVTPSAGGALILAGAAADALMLLRCTEGSDDREVVYRPVNLMQALVLGWSSLALLGPEVQEQLRKGGYSLGPSLARDPVAAAHAVPNLVNCRDVLQNVLAKCDSDFITPSVVWSLLANCAFDLAAALSSACSTMEPANNLAALAAAGRWDKVSSTLTSEVGSSLTHPKPPVPGSVLHMKLVAAAAGAVAHGSYAQALRFLQLAGEWRLALVLAAAHGDFSAVSDVAHNVAQALGDTGASTSGYAEPGGAVDEAREAARTATLLRTIYSGVGVDNTVHDARLKLAAPEVQAPPRTDEEKEEMEKAGPLPGLGEPNQQPRYRQLPDASGWKLGGAGADLTAEAAPPEPNPMRGMVNENELGAIPPNSRKILHVYLGMDSYTNYALEAAIGSTNPVPAETPDSTPRAAAAERKGKKEGEEQEGAAPPPVAPKADAHAPVGWGAVGPVGTLGGNADDMAGDSDFDDDDWGEAALASGPAQKKNLKIQIRSKEEIAAGGQGAAGQDLRKAASALKLGPPGSLPPLRPPPGAPALSPQNSDAFGKVSPSGSTATAGATPHSDDSWFGGPPPPVKTAPPPPPDLGNPFEQPPTPLSGNQSTGLTPKAQGSGLTPVPSTALPPSQPTEPDEGDDLLSFFAPTSAPPPPPPQPPQQQQLQQAQVQQQRQQLQQRASMLERQGSEGAAAAIAAVEEFERKQAQAAQPPAARAGMSPALQAGMAPPQQQQPQRQPQPAAHRAGLSPALQAGMSPALAAGLGPQQQQQAPGSFKAGLSPALQAGMSPALAAGLSRPPQQQPPQPPQPQPPQPPQRPPQQPTPPQQPGYAPQRTGMSPALQAGMSPALQSSLSPQPSAGRSSPALHTGLTPTHSGPHSNLSNSGRMSPALQTGLTPQSSATAAPPAAAAAPPQQPTPTPPQRTGGMSPALQAGLAPQQQQPPQAGYAAQRTGMSPALQAGLSPALQAGMQQQKPQQPPQQQQQQQQPGYAPQRTGLSPALQAGMQQQKPQQPPQQQQQQQQQQPGYAPQRTGMSPALQAGLQQPKPPQQQQQQPGYAAQRTGMSPALQAGLSPALAAGLAPKQPPQQPPQPPQQPGYAPQRTGGVAPALQTGMSPALAAGLAPRQQQLHAQGSSAAPGSPSAAAAAQSRSLGGAGGAGGAGAAPQAAAAGAGQGGSPQQLYFAGVAQLEAGNWRGADATFARTMDALAGAPPGPARDKQISFCAQYLAAVKLLSTASATPPGSSGPHEAKLYRFAAALGLDKKHQLVLMREAASRNRACRNFRYAGEQLTKLVTQALGTAPPEYLARLQAEIDECDRAGDTDASVLPHEQLETWAKVIASAKSADAVQQAVAPLLFRG